jgi:hypothetical protein
MLKESEEPMCGGRDFTTHGSDLLSSFFLISKVWGIIALPHSRLLEGGPHAQGLLHFVVLTWTRTRPSGSGPERPLVLGRRLDTIPIHQSARARVPVG